MVCICNVTTAVSLLPPVIVQGEVFIQLTQCRGPREPCASSPLSLPCYDVAAAWKTCWICSSTCSLTALFRQDRSIYCLTTDPFIISLIGKSSGSAGKQKPVVFSPPGEGLWMMEYQYFNRDFYCHLVRHSRAGKQFPVCCSSVLPLGL